MTVQCTVQKGSIVEKGSDWVFVSKFCFSTAGEGNLTWTVFAEDESGGQGYLLLFYDDVAESWPEVYGNRKSLTCQEKVARARANRTVVTGEMHIQPFKDHERAHFWYFAMANCGAAKLDFQYQFELTNAGSSWSRQFSYDEQGLTAMYLFFWLFFTALTVVHMFGAWKLHVEGVLHPVVRLFATAVVAQTMALLVYFIHYIVYTSNGIGAPGLQGLGNILDMISQVVLMFVLILVAMGWGITQHHVQGKNLVVVLVSALVLGYMTMFVWDNVSRNPASTLYIYESAAGIIILLLRTLTWVWFSWSLFRSYVEEHQPKKRNFYRIFGSVFTLWFLMLPLIVVLAVAISPWDRLKAVTGMYLCMNAMGFTALVMLFWPTWAAEYFDAIGNPDKMLLASSHEPYNNL